MIKLKYQIDIAASQEKAFNTMIGVATYPVWTKPFNEKSNFIGDWSEGSKIIFVGADKDGNTGGMVSRIAANRPYDFISIEHYGVLEGDKEITEGENVAEWAGAHENYTFTKYGDKTRVSIEMDTVESSEPFFAQAWPKALQELKRLSEN